MVKTKNSLANWSPRTVFRPVGYCLLILAIIDIIYILFPVQLLDFNWELAIIPQLVERVAVPLIAIALIFYGESRVDSITEKRILQALRWFSLFLGVLFLLLLPLIMVDTPRLQAQINSEVSIDPQKVQQTNQKIEQSQNQEQIAINRQKIELFNRRRGLEQREQLVDRLETVVKEGKDAEFKTLVTRLNQNQPVDDRNLANAKADILKNAPEIRKQLQGQIQQVIAADTKLKSTASQAALKSAIKYSIGTLLSGILFVYIWRVNR